MRKAGLSSLISSFLLLLGFNGTAMSENPKTYFSDPKLVGLCEAIARGNLATIDNLVAQSVDVNARGRDGMTPLIFSFPSLNKAGLRRLLEHGADPNLQEEASHYSFMRYAARAEDSDYLRMALENGGDPNLRGRMNETPIFDVALANNSGFEERMALLLEHGADINAFNVLKQNAAMAAAGVNQYESTLFLLEEGIDYKQEDKAGYTLAYPLEENGIGYNPGHEGYDARTRVAQFLIDRGVEVQLKKPLEAPSDWLEASFSVIGKPVPAHLK